MHGDQVRYRPLRSATGQVGPRNKVSGPQQLVALRRHYSKLDLTERTSLGQRRADHRLVLLILSTGLHHNPCRPQLQDPWYERTEAFIPRRPLRPPLDRQAPQVGRTDRWRLREPSQDALPARRALAVHVQPATIQRPHRSPRTCHVLAGHDGRAQQVAGPLALVDKNFDRHRFTLSPPCGGGDWPCLTQIGCARLISPCLGVSVMTACRHRRGLGLFASARPTRMSGVDRGCGGCGRNAAWCGGLDARRHLGRLAAGRRLRVPR